MNRFLVYLLIIFTYLGISKSFYPNKQVTISIPNKEAISSIFRASPISIILIDMDEVGLIMKTYLMKYLIIGAYQDPVTVTIKTNQKFWEESKQFIGMSIFRRMENEEQESTIPMPPGFLFIGDTSFGQWKYNRESGEREWNFYRTFSKLEKNFNYGNYKPTHSMIKNARRALKSDLPYFGDNNEFGFDGKITREYLKTKLFNKKKFEVDYDKHFARFFRI